MADEERRGRGQPPKGDLAKTETLRIRVTRAERELVEGAARQRGETLSAYVRGVVLRAAARAGR